MSTSSTPTPLSTAPISTSTVAASCAVLREVFQHPLREEPPTRAALAAERRQHAELVAAASTACSGCPLVAPCLYRAVVEHDVAGFAGGTTARQRREIRRLLDVTVRPEDLDTLAGVVGGRQVDHQEVLRLRAAHPDESLEVLAGRLGCSLSTVKRHLRRERTLPSRPGTGGVKPRLAQVLAAAAEVTGGDRTAQRAA